MLKFKKQICFLIATVMVICLSVGIFMLMPRMTANAATYYISADNDRAEQPAGTTHQDISNILKISGTELQGFTDSFKTTLGRELFYLKVPATVGGITLKSISADAFTGTNIVGLDLSATSITEIKGVKGSSDGNWPEANSNNGAFANCKQLQTVKLPNNLTKLGEIVFHNCSSLISITIPATVSEIGMGTFARCTSLDTVKFEGTALKIFENGLFYQDKVLRHINIPTSVEEIQTGVFNGCAKITRLDLSNVKRLHNGTGTGNAPFYGMTRLAEVHLPTTIQTVSGRTDTNWTQITCSSSSYRGANATGLGYLLYRPHKVDDSATNYDSDGFNDGNAIFNVYYGTGANQIGQSNYVEINDFVFVKNTIRPNETTAWQTGTIASTKSRNNSDSNLRTTAFKIAFEANMWYMVDYGGTGNKDADRPLQFPTQEEFKKALDENGMTVKDANGYTYDLAPRIFGDNTMHMFNAKISDAVRIIGNEAFAGSSLQVIDMSEATRLTYIGSGYLRAVPSPIIYLPDRQDDSASRAFGSLDSINNDYNKPVHIGLFYNDFPKESWVAPQMIICPNYESYELMRDSSKPAYNWSHYNTAEELTYLMPVNMHYEGASGGTSDDPYDTEERMYNKEFNYVRLSSNKWGYDYSITDLPAQNGYSKSVWYKDDGYTAAQRISNLNELNDSLRKTVNSIELYARTVLKPDGTTTGGNSNLEIEYTYESDKSYEMGDLNNLFVAVDKPYEIYDGSVAVITAYRPTFGDYVSAEELAKIKSVSNAGVYTIMVNTATATNTIDYGTWSAPVYITITVDQRAIDLSATANDGVTTRLEHLDFSVPGGLSSGPIKVVNNIPTRITAFNNGEGEYLAYNSVANSTGGIITVSFSESSKHPAYYTERQATNVSGDEVGVYESIFNLEISNANYTFAALSDVGVTELNKYGITVSVTGYGSLAQITKVWYIIGSDNAFVIKSDNTEKEAYDVFADKVNSVTFGQAVSVNMPDVLVHRNDDAEKDVIRFTLQILSDNVAQNIYANVGETRLPVTSVVEGKTINNLNDYINSSMPVGTYRLHLYYPEVPSGSGSDTYCAPLENSYYEFKVKKAQLSTIDEVQAVIGVLNKHPTYQLQYKEAEGKGVVQFYDSDLQTKVAALKAINMGAKRTGIWENGTWAYTNADKETVTGNFDNCYSEVEIKFNLDRMRSNNYLAPNDTSLNSGNAPINPDTYRVYWQITAENYEDSVDITRYEDRIQDYYSVVIYELIDVNTTAQDVTYTGGRVLPVFEESEHYRISWTDNSTWGTTPYVNRGQHEFKLILNDPTHYRWKTSDSTDEVTGNKIVTFNIVTVTNSWRDYPKIQGWKYDGNANAAPTAVWQYGEEVIFTYYKAVLNSDGTTYSRGEEIARDKLVDAGVYIMNAYVPTNDTNDWGVLDTDVQFIVSKLGIAAPAVNSVEYNGEWQTAGIVDGEYYTVSGNVGWTDVGKYTITVNIKDNYEWVITADDAENLDPTKKILTRVFEITRVVNDWTTDPSVLGWTWNQYDDTANAFNAIPEIYAHTGKAPVEAVQWFIYSDAERKTLELSFGYAANGTLSDTVRKNLNGLLAGTYYVTAKVSGNDNIGDLNRNLVFAVSPVTNTWDRTPNIFSWTYAEFEDGKVISAGEPRVGNYQNVIYSVYYDSKCEKAVEGLEGFALNGNGEVMLQAVKNKLNLLTADTYYLRVAVDAADRKYTGLSTTITFKVNEAVNTWLTSPYVSPWVNGYWQGVDKDGNLNNTPVAIAKFGNTNIVIIDDSGKKYYEAVYHKETVTAEAYLEEITNVFKGNETDVASGRYKLVATVAGVPGQYTGIAAADGTIVFEIYASSASIPANFWTELPAIENWTAGDSASTPVGTPMRGNKVVFTYYNTKQNDSGAYEIDLESPVSGVPTAVGHYYMAATVYYPEHRDFLYDLVMFEIYERVNRWTVTPSIKDWFLSETASNPVAEDAEGGDITYLYKLADAADETAKAEKPTTDGNYVMIVTCKAEYCKDLVERVNFSILLATNKWEKIPTIEGWSEEFEPNAPTGVAANGEVVYTYWTVKYENGVAVADRYIEEGKPTAEGTYIMRATVKAYGYEDLVEDIEFTISPAWDETFLIIDTVLAVVAVIATIVVIAIVVRRKNRC